MTEEQEFKLPPPMDTREAIEWAVEALRQQINQTNTAEGKALFAQARETLTALWEQRGCEELGIGADDGLLTTVCDIAIFG